MVQKNKKSITVAIRKAATVKDSTRQQLFLAAIVSEILRSIKLNPVLVGGATVQFYTLGHYSTLDVDLVLPSVLPSEIKDKLEIYGFKREMDLRHWMHPLIPIPIEFPPSPLQVGSTLVHDVNEIDVDGFKLQIIKLEDIILDRVIAAEVWKSRDDKRQAEALLSTNYDKVNWSYLHSKASENKVLQVLKEIQKQVKKNLKTLPKKQKRKRK